MKQRFSCHIGELFPLYPVDTGGFLNFILGINEQQDGLEENKLLEQVPSRYMLVNVVAQRARQIASEAEENGISLDDKPVTLAIREVAEGKVTPVAAE